MPTIDHTTAEAFIMPLRACVGHRRGTKPTIFAEISGMLAALATPLSSGLLVGAPRAPHPCMMASGLHGLSANRIDGTSLEFSTLEGKPAVMVNSSLNSPACVFFSC